MSNIEYYLNSLPSKTNGITLSNRDRYTLPDLSRFSNLKFLYLSNCKLTWLPYLSDTIEYLDITNNEITFITNLPKNLKTLFCNNNKLRYLPKLPNNLKNLWCSDNGLYCLPSLPVTLELLVCKNNQLKKLPPLSTSLKYLICAYNHLNSIPLFTPELEYIDLQNNPISTLPNIISERVTIVLFNTNVLDDWKLETDIEVLKRKIRIVNRFKDFFYANKYKEKFRNWLWVKIREPKIQEHFHPQYLLENVIDEETDLDEVLSKW